MPPRYSYWTILAGGLPTAFRAAERADLLPTFNRIREKHPDAEMKWFARGRLWSSPEEAQADLKRERVKRDRDWRPGGDHRDPRQAFRKRKAARRQPGQQGPQTEPGASSGTRTGAQDRPHERRRGARPPGHRPQGSRSPGGRPKGARADTPGPRRGRQR